METVYAAIFAVAVGGDYNQQDWNDMASAFPLCPTEDSANCVWNAAVQGDGFGRSFIAVANPDGSDVVVAFAPDAEGEVETRRYPD